MTVHPSRGVRRPPAVTAPSQELPALPRLRGSALVEFAMVLPMMLAGLLGIITFSLAMFGQQVAANAAAHAARVAAITQSGRVPAATSSAQYSLQVLPMSKNWTVKVCQGQIPDSCVPATAGTLGDTARVEVHWETPNFVGAFLPGLPATPLRGIAAATYRNEGW